MKFDEDGLLDEPCLSCDKAYVENIWHEWCCDEKECPHTAESEDQMSKEKVIEILKELWRYERTSKFNEKQIREALEIAESAVEMQKTGQWIRITNGAMKEKYICSVCHRIIEDDGIEALITIKYPYCHCGAKMEDQNADSN